MPEPSRTVLTITLALLLWSALACRQPEARSQEAGTTSQEGNGSLQEADTYLRAIVPYGFHGAVLVAKDGEILLHQGYGLADKVKGVVVGEETLFDVGSITKPFTAAAVLTLEEAGRLSVEDPLGLFFPELPDEKAAITLHQLLTHTSGLPSNLGADYDPLSRDELLAGMASASLQFPPGERFSYSNLGYGLLAAVVETVSGQPFETYLEEHLLAPAGLRRTGYRPSGVEKEEVAHFSPSRSPFPNPLDRTAPSFHLKGSGGLLSTAGDLLRWHRALGEGKALGAEALRRHQSAQEPWTGRDGVSYGYGWEVARTPRGTTVLRHNGGNREGANATFRRFVDEDAVIVFLSHELIDGAPPLFFLPPLLERALFGGNMPQVPATVDAPAEELAPFEGRYRLETSTLTVEAEGGALRAKAEGAGAALKLFLPGAGRGNASEEALKGEQALRALQAGDFGAYLASLPDPRSAESQRSFWETWWSKAEAELGPLQGIEPAGETPYGDVHRVWFVVTFAEGRRLVRMDLEGGTRLFIADWSTSLVGDRTLFFRKEARESGTAAFVTFDVVGGVVVRLAAERAEDGSVSALLLQGLRGPAARAPRIEDEEETS